MKRINKITRQPDQIADLLARRYPVTLHPEAEGGYSAQIERLPGCISQGETLEEAMVMIDDARRLWIETAFEDGNTVPEPDGDAAHNGRILLRLPRSLHQRIARTAAQEGVSLNHYLVSLISENHAVHRLSRPAYPVLVRAASGHRVSESAPTYRPSRSVSAKRLPQRVRKKRD